MKRFSQLFAELDATTSTKAKVDALQRYFAAAPAADAAWAVYFLAGGKPRQVVPMALLAQLACEEAGIAPWLFDECYQAVGDLAETIAHVLPDSGETSPRWAWPSGSRNACCRCAACRPRRSRRACAAGGASWTTRAASC